MDIKQVQNNSVCTTNFCQNNHDDDKVKKFDPGKTKQLKNITKQSSKSSIHNINNILKSHGITCTHVIGKGSFAVVYLATIMKQTSKSKDSEECEEFKKSEKSEKIALKCIDLEKMDSDRIEKFELELEISKTLIHENIVRCFDVIKTNKYWFLLNEFCNQGTFVDIIKSIKVLDFQQRELYGHHYISQLKNAICYLHSHNIVHRDLKPANILVSNKDANSKQHSSLNEIVKLADFGLARYFDVYNLNDCGYDDMITTMCGSPMYMAPELLIDHAYHIKADLWSFGVIMYELLYGTNPYNYPKSIVNLTELIKKKQINYPPTLTPLCIDLLKKLLVVDPTQRISWDDFINHEWFSQIIISESDDDLCNDNVCDYNNTTIDDSAVSDSNIVNLDLESSSISTTNTVANFNLPSKTIIIPEKNRKEAFERARSMKDTFQFLKHKGRTLSEISSHSSTESVMKNKKSNSTSSILYDMTENFLDTHFGSDIEVDTAKSLTSAKTNKKKEHKKSPVASLTKILTDSVSFWVSNKGAIT